MELGLAGFFLLLKDFFHDVNSMNYLLDFAFTLALLAPMLRLSHYFIVSNNYEVAITL